ncbi:MAG TPA: DUF3127 domain-containing protein [Bacteroidales bacterium]|nr:DUF3127 domain-containing protein [Bacteroidales bacterium]
MKITVKGTILEIHQKVKKEKKENGTEYSYSQQFILQEENEDYNNKLKFDCWKEKCRLLDDLVEGCRISVEFYFKSSESKGKWYTNMYVINIKRLRINYKIDDANPGEPDPEIEPEPPEKDSIDKCVRPFQDQLISDKSSEDPTEIVNW